MGISSQGARPAGLIQSQLGATGEPFTARTSTIIPPLPFTTASSILEILLLLLFTHISYLTTYSGRGKGPVKRLAVQSTMDDKGTYSTTREVEMQRLMSEESSGADTDPLSSDYEEAHFDKTSSSQAFWQRPRIPAWRRLVQAWPVRQSSLRRKRDNEAEEDYSEAAKLSTVLPRRRSLMCMVLTSILGYVNQSPPVSSRKY